MADMQVTVSGTAQPDSGLTSEEAKVLAGLVAAWTAFTELPAVHPDHLDDFRQAIHTAQRILAIRVVQRMFPGAWGHGR